MDMVAAVRSKTTLELQNMAGARARRFLVACTKPIFNDTSQFVHLPNMCLLLIMLCICARVMRLLKSADRAYAPTAAVKCLFLHSLAFCRSVRPYKSRTIFYESRLVPLCVCLCECLGVLAFLATWPSWTNELWFVHRRNLCLCLSLCAHCSPLSRVWLCG